MTVSPNWHKDAEEFGWVMPSAPWWKRMPVVRHIRFVFLGIAVARHTAFWISVGKIPTGHDEWVLHGILHGMERS